MSSFNTPTRSGREIIVPLIDTTNHADKSSTAWTCHGLYTPPGSAHESRRGSHATLPDTSYAAVSSAFAQSQPATPVHSMHTASQSFEHPWTQSADLNAEMNAAIAAHNMPIQRNEHTVQAAFHQRMSSGTNMEMNALSVQNTFSHINNVDALCNLPLRSTPQMSGSWSHPNQATHPYAAHSTCLGPALFPTSHGLRLDTNVPIPENAVTNSYMHSFGTGLECTGMEYLQGYSTPMSAGYQCPQVVVPSQLSPEDAYMQHNLRDYITPDHSNDGLSSSFASSTAFGSFELIDPPSPMQDYFDHPDQDYVMVKDEDPNDPEYFDSARGSMSYSGTPRAAASSKRRSARRARSDRKRPWHKHTVGEVEVCCQGTRFDFDSTIRIQTASTHKKFTCRHIEANGEPCRRAFDRSEHLKRHMGKHSKERPYPCYLPGCDQKTQRSDNAVQHFQTHIRPHTNGKRNGHFDWPTVHMSILENYEDQKRARKLLDNLQKWVDNGMPETTSSRGKRD